MNKAELIAKVAETTGQTKVAVTEVVGAVFTTVKERLYQEEEVSIAGFGKFGVKKRDARTGRNPATGEAVEISAKNAAFFKPAKELKEYIQDDL